MFSITKSYHRPPRKFRPLIFLIGFVTIILLYLIFHGDILGNIEKREVTVQLEGTAEKFESTEIFNNVEEESLVFEENPTDWKFNTSKHYQPSRLFKWATAKAAVKHTILPGNGEHGEEFKRIDSSDPEMKRLLEENNYNLMATEMMSLHRSLPDYRCDECKQMIYPAKLPKTSFILIFHDEAWSLILRSIWSIIERSPRELIEEIILVDDLSTWPELHRSIEDYIELLPVRVRLFRNQKREGLIRSRLIGANAANGQVLIFFDAHIEVTDGWLEPLLANIVADRSLVAIPHIDWISSSTMKFDATDYGLFSRYNWGLALYWSAIPERELKRVNYSKTALIRLPMHVGCAFAVDRDFFFEIGSYDEGMDIWGSENLDLALRAWLCGGSMQLVQCSRIGHFYRVSTYSFDGDQGQIITRNSKRLAEVWLDDVKDILYAMYPNMVDVDAGDLTERKNLRDRLKCKSFRWYLENIYPESRLSDKFIAFGEIRNMADDKCLDNHDIETGRKILTYDCHNMGGNQFVAFTQSGLIVTFNENLCIGISNDGSAVPSAVIVECSDTDKTQRWRYDNEVKTIQHIENGLCMKSVEDQSEIALDACNSSNTRFQWVLGHHRNP